MTLSGFALFQPTLPARGATRSPHRLGNRHRISTHAPRTGSDPNLPARLRLVGEFQPTLPARGATEFAPRCGLHVSISTHAPRTGSDASCDRLLKAIPMPFQPTLPARGATIYPFSVLVDDIISTHAPRTGSDVTVRDTVLAPSDFNPRSPHGERPCWISAASSSLIFQPTLPARGATGRGQRAGVERMISTHAPRTGSDAQRSLLRPSNDDFNPRSPHGERPIASATPSQMPLFQPTLPARGATTMEAIRIAPIHFNPRSPHGERPPRRGRTRRRNGISTHAPRTGSDDGFRRLIQSACLFQPTLPARGATDRGSHQRPPAAGISTHAPRTGSDTSGRTSRRRTEISTHAPRTGSDSSRTTLDPRTGGISTHAPRTGSDGLSRRPDSRTPRFQPTLPARGATRGDCGVQRRRPDFNPRSPHGERRHIARHNVHHRRISTHAPRTGSDLNLLDSGDGVAHFNPRSPHGERPNQAGQPRRKEDFNPRSPHGERPMAKTQMGRFIQFQPTLPARGATVPNQEGPRARKISTHAPRTGSDSVPSLISPP